MLIARDGHETTITHDGLSGTVYPLGNGWAYYIGDEPAGWAGTRDAAEQLLQCRLYRLAGGFCGPLHSPEDVRSEVVAEVEAMFRRGEMPAEQQLEAVLM